MNEWMNEMSKQLNDKLKLNQSINQINPFLMQVFLAQ